MSSAVDALALDEWWVMDVVLREGEGRNRRRRANSEDLRATPVLKGGPDGGLFPGLHVDVRLRRAPTTTGAIPWSSPIPNFTERVVHAYT